MSRATKKTTVYIAENAKTAIGLDLNDLEVWDVCDGTAFRVATQAYGFELGELKKLNVGKNAGYSVPFEVPEEKRAGLMIFVEFEPRFETQGILRMIQANSQE